MVNQNVVALDEFKQKRLSKIKKESYQKYLETLQNVQLESEINFLLDEFSSDDQDQDFSLKVQLVQKELVKRADGHWKIKIAQIINEPRS